MLKTNSLRKVLSAVAAAAMLWLTPAIGAAAPLVELKAGSSTPQADQATESLRKFAEIGAAKSGGEIVVNVFPQSLGVEHQLVQGAQAGSVDIGMITNGNSSRFTNAYLVLDLSFLFKKYDDLLDFMNAPAGREFISVP